MNISSKEINLIQQIHNRVHNLNMDLPAITVVGSQSSGKSSVLESLINVDILPRGTNLVTRCPIILHLKKAVKEECVEIDKRKYLLKKNNQLIKNKILKMMDKICGTDKEISSNSIVIDIWLLETLEFTIIDLPGITKVAIGKQSEDIEIKILNIIREYITSKNTIILAIINSNIDISNSEALKICKEVDPNFSRTIGVLTKIDLMDKGTDCISILQNTVYPLKLGYVGVINRSQQDIKNNINVQNFKNREKAFFANSVYKNLNNTGCLYLLNRISLLYQNKVKEILPKLEENLKIKLKELQGGTYVDTFILRYKYQLVLNKLISTDKKVTDIFFFDSNNIIYDLLMFKNLKVTYDFSNIKSMIATDLSIFINDNLLFSLIKFNMQNIKNNIITLQNQYKKILLDKIRKIYSDKFPEVCKVFNECIIAEIDKWDIDYKLSEYVDVLSNVIGNTDLFFKNAVTTNLFGTHLYFKGSSKEDILKEFTRMYLDKQVNNIIEYSLKLNFYKINELIEKTGMECISKVNIEGLEEMNRYLKDVVNRNEDSKNILEAINLLRNNITTDI